MYYFSYLAHFRRNSVLFYSLYDIAYISSDWCWVIQDN